MDSPSTRERRYHSPRRSAQAAETRRRILDALVATMAADPAEASVPAVARRAGVSIASVYRYFPTKRDMYRALPDHFADRIGLSDPPPIEDVDDLDALIHELFGKLDLLDDEERAAIISASGREARRAQLPERFTMVKAAVAAAAQRADDAIVERIARLTVVLISTSSIQMLRDLGLSAHEAADDVAWVVRLAIADNKDIR